MNIEALIPAAGRKGFFSMTIKLLEDDLINKIAAGEVVERPASIVKELVENSIDAKANDIRVKISGGGRERIEVEDNGQGIKYEEVNLAFLRHATSKIRQEADLQRILSLGFRGEALPSIASVSRVDLYSQSAGEKGVHVSLEGGQVLQQEIYPSAPGTRIVVKDLFFNTPARQKFLKSPVTESNYIYELMCKYALSRPDISFSYSSERKNYFKTPGQDSLLDTIMSIYGKDFTDQLMEVYYKGQDYLIKGFISQPEMKRSNRKNQLIFINRRPISSPVIYRAIDQAYQGRLLSREHPVVILSIDLDPAQVDVNVHPQKSQVRFQDEQGVFRVVLDVLRSRLENSHWGVKLNYFQGDKLPPLSIQENKILEYEKRPEQGAIFKQYEKPPWAEQDRESKDLLPSPDTIIPELEEESGEDTKIIGQAFDSYILLQKDNSLWIADQHAAHERVIYNQLRDSIKDQRAQVQDLIIPITLELSSKEMDILQQYLESFQSLGFELQVIGPNSIALRGVPQEAWGREKEILYGILDELLTNKGVPDLYGPALNVISCKQAVKAVTRLSTPEMAKIISSLLALDDYGHCPHGRPTIIRLSYEDLERMFKRR
jgi:DNA mismatch repair protein MutL